MDSFLTQKQTQVLEVIRDFYLKEGFAPSLSELQGLLGISTKRGVVVHLEALEKKGFIIRTSEPRGIQIVSDDANYEYLIGIPILGYANAGLPLAVAKEEYIGTLNIDKDLVGKYNNLFSVIIKGDSMNMMRVGNYFMEDSSYALVQKQDKAEDGDIVLAVIDDAATLKVFRKEKDFIKLSPCSSNDKHQPFYIGKNRNIFINGVVVQVLPQ